MTPAVLAIDCATAGLSLVLQSGGKTWAFSTPAARSSDLLPTELHNLFAKSGLSATHLRHVYTTTGPGSFTGIRLGLATAEALKLVNKNIEIIGLSTLQAHAVQVAATRKPAHAFTIVLDAAGGHAYHQTFNPDAGSQSSATCSLLTALPSTPLYAESTLLLEATPLQPLDPRHLLTLAANPANHLPPIPAYLKPLTYKPAQS